MYRVTNFPVAVAQSTLPRLALIGISGYGAIYVGLLREALLAKSVSLVAAVVINPGQEQEIVAELRAGGTVIYGSADELFACEAGKIDLCLIPTGIQWHARMTIAALTAGMNVLVEKPLAGSVADCAAIRRAEVATGCWVAVGFQDIYADEARRLKSQLLEGAIGRLREVKMTGLWPRPRSYFTRNHWAGRRAADGASVLDSPLNNAFAHFVNLGLFFAGSTAGTSASVAVESAELFRAHAIETFDTAVVRGVSSHGVRFWCGFSHATETTREPEILLYGDEGCVEWRHETSCVTTHADGRRETVALPTAASCRGSMFAAVLARLADAGSSICDTDVACRHAEFIEAVQNEAVTRPFPETLVSWRADAAEHGEFPNVRGLDVAIDRAFSRGGLLGSPDVFCNQSLHAATGR
jgi:predicted dehydrogenase